MALFKPKEGFQLFQLYYPLDCSKGWKKKKKGFGLADHLLFHWTLKRSKVLMVLNSTSVVSVSVLYLQPIWYSHVRGLNYMINSEEYDFTVLTGPINLPECNVMINIYDLAKIGIG